MKSMINAEIRMTSFKDLLEVVDTQRKNEQPHPFCITGKHIKRYHIDPACSPCGMRVNPDDSTKWGKYNKKKGITATCGLSFEEHTYNVQVLFKILKGFPIQKLEDALGQGGALESVFTNFFIQGFAFEQTEPQFELTK